MVATKEIIVRTVGKGIRGDPIKVNLPSYQIVKILGEWKAKVLVPDDEVDIDSVTGIVSLNKNKIRQKYIGQKWDYPEVCDDVIVK